MSGVRARATAGGAASVAWLIGAALLGVRWASPLSSFYSRAILSDAFFAVAALFAAIELLARRRRPQWHTWQAWLVAYVAWAAVAAIAAPAHSTAFKTVLLITELAVIAVLTASLAADERVARTLTRVTLAAVAATFLLAVVALVLFYAGHRTGLLGEYGDLQPSSRFARIRLGFESPDLLASWCIAASAILAWRRDTLPRYAYLGAQAALAVLVVATFARGALGFGAALAIRWAAQSPSPARKAVAAAAVAGVVAVLAVLTVGRLHIDPSRPSSISYEVSNTSPRREAIVTSWRTLRAHPLVGSGPGSYPGRNLVGLPFRAHLTPLNVAATTGIPALLALVGMAVWLWRGRSRPTDIAIWSGLVGLMLDGLTQDVEHFRHVWLMVGLAAVASRR